MNASPPVGFRNITQGNIQSFDRSQRTDKNGNISHKVDLHHIDAKEGFQGDYFGDTAKISCSLADLSNGRSLKLNNICFNNITLPEGVEVNDNAIVTIYMVRGQKEGETDSVRFKLRGGGARFDAEFSNLNLEQKEESTHTINFKNKTDSGKDYTQYNETNEGYNSDTYINKQNEKIPIARGRSAEIGSLEEYFGISDLKQYLVNCLDEKPKAGQKSFILEQLNELRNIKNSKTSETPEIKAKKEKIEQLLSFTYAVGEEMEQKIHNDFSEKLTELLKNFNGLGNIEKRKETQQAINTLRKDTAAILLERFDTIQLHGLALKQEVNEGGEKKTTDTDLTKEQYKLKINEIFKEAENALETHPLVEGTPNVARKTHITLDIG